MVQLSGQFSSVRLARHSRTLCSRLNWSWVRRPGLDSRSSTSERIFLALDTFVWRTSLSFPTSSGLWKSFELLSSLILAWTDLALASLAWSWLVADSTWSMASRRSEGSSEKAFYWHFPPFTLICAKWNDRLNRWKILGMMHLSPNVLLAFMNGVVKLWQHLFRCLSTFKRFRWGSKKRRISWEDFKLSGL